MYPKEGSYWNDRSVMDPLRAMFGERLIPLDKAEDVCEVIAAAIGVAEGIDINAVGAALKDIGMDGAAVGRAMKAVAVFSTGAAVAKAAKVDGELAPTSGDSDVERL